MVGDFNVVLTNYKRLPISFSSKDEKFSDFVQYSSLIDLPLAEGKFIGRNSCQVAHWIDFF